MTVLVVLMVSYFSCPNILDLVSFTGLIESKSHSADSSKTVSDAFELFFDEGFVFSLVVVISSFSWAFFHS